MGEPGAGMPARRSIWRTTAGSCSSAFTSRFTLATISSGVRAGAASPDQPAASKPGSVSAIGGMKSSGAAARRAVVTASALMRLSVIGLNAAAVLSIISLT